MLEGAQDPYITINVVKLRGEGLDWLYWPNVEYPDIF